jgi:hypothetical protein
MITQQEDRELVRCLRLIEEKVGWGRSDGWATQDFERLSERIAEQTGRVSERYDTQAGVGPGEVRIRPYSNDTYYVGSVCGIRKLATL